MFDYVEVEVVGRSRIYFPLGALSKDVINPETHWLVTIKKPQVIKVLLNPERI